MKYRSLAVALAQCVALATFACSSSPDEKAAATTPKPATPKEKLTPGKAKAVAGGKAAGPQGGTPTSPSAGITKDGKTVVDTSQDGDEEGSDLAWLVTEDMDGDGAEEDVTVVYDDETDTTYLFWGSEYDDGECSDGDAITVIEVEADGSYDVTQFFTCDGENLAAGCSFSAEDECQGCGACTFDDEGALDGCASAAEACE